MPKLLELCENLSSSLEGMEAMLILEGLKSGALTMRGVTEASMSSLFYFRSLQERALDRLKAKEDLKSTGKVRLKLKLAKALWEGKPPQKTVEVWQAIYQERKKNRIYFFIPRMKYGVSILCFEFEFKAT